MDTTRPKQQEESLLDIPFDTTLLGMTTLLDPERVLSVLREKIPSAAGVVSQCRVAYVRYKPNTNCLASYAVTFAPSGSDQTSTIWLSGKCYTEADFSVALSKRSALTFESLLGITRPIILREERIIILPAEQDPLMAGLQTAFNSRKLVRLLHKHLEDYPKKLWRISDRRCNLDFIRFKPEKRAVLRLSTKVVSRDSGEKRKVVWYIRAYANASGLRLHQLMSELRENFSENPSVGVATSLAAIKEKNLLIMDHADGIPLEGQLSDSKIVETIERVGHALALLHTFRSTGVPVFPFREQLSDIASNALSLKVLLPDAAGVIDKIVSTLHSRKPKGNTSSARFVHGDFHPGQILIDSGRIVILDFDRAHIGDPFCDLGNFAACLHLFEMRSEITNASDLIKKLIASYSGVAGNGIDMDRIRFWTIAGLFGLAVSPFRLQRPGWRSEITTILDRCAQL